MKRLKISAALAAAALSGLLSGPAHAQFGSLRETFTPAAPTQTTTGTPGGATVKLGQVDRPIYIGINPYTLFQVSHSIQDAQTSAVATETGNAIGPLVVVEKTFRLEDPTSFSLGTWYWFNNSKTDRLGIYGKYGINSRIGVQGTIGGSTHTGFDEYYAFLLYNVLRGSAKLPLSAQVGVGPYIPRKGEGDAGYTGTIQASYAGKGNLSYNASLWYVKYNQNFPDLALKSNNTTARFSLGVGYTF